MPNKIVKGTPSRIGISSSDVTVEKIIRACSISESTPQVFHNASLSVVDAAEMTAVNSDSICIQQRIDLVSSVKVFHQAVEDMWPSRGIRSS